MKAKELYEHLEKDFIFENLEDDWARYMKDIEGYLSPIFKERSMGLVCDFATDITKVYSAVFPTEEVMKKIIEDNAKDAMLFLHHPSIWDSRRPMPFYQMDKKFLDKFKENRISIYNLHVPLDNFSEYSTSKTLAEALGIEIEKPFFKYRGSLSGVIGKTKFTNIDELQAKFSEILGHEAKLYLYGEKNILDGKVAVIAGGGNVKEAVDEMLKEQIHVLITGISSKNKNSLEVHELEKENKVNVLGGTHYSTEKFACKKMCEYFEKLGLPAEFIEGYAVYEDM